MSETSKYSKLAMSGKWISLARLWIEDNAPCSREKMFVELGSLMPGHIRASNESLYTSSQLVKQAYKRIFKTNSIPNVIEKPVVTVRFQDGVTHQIREMLRQHEILNYSQIKHLKNAGSLISRLVKEGECVRVAPRLYRRTDKLKLQQRIDIT